MKLRYQIALGLALMPLILWFGTVVLALVRGMFDRCPRCHSAHIRPSWRRLRERVLPVFVAPFRCEHCRHRFYTLRSVDYAQIDRPSTP